MRPFPTTGTTPWTPPQQGYNAAYLRGRTIDLDELREVYTVTQRVVDG
jgi:hypothetical protein